MTKSKKGKCHLCDKKDGLVIVKTGWNSWDLFCKDHFCEKHARAFSKYANEVASCNECRVEERKKARQGEAERREKELAAQLENMRKREDERRKNIELERERRNKVMAEKLVGIFGKELGDAPPSGLSKVGGMYWSFVPQKQFRKFNEYYLGVKGGKIIVIRAMQVIDDADLAEKEFWAVVNLLDRKYSAERRSEVSEDGYKKRCCYVFSCVEGCNPQQQLIVSLGRIPKMAGQYQIVISASLVAEIESVIDAEERKDMDAL